MPFGLKTPPTGTSPTYTCVGCGESVNPRARNVASKVTGWVVPRTKGGANHIRNQEALGEYAHVVCLVDMTDPTQGEQESLF